MKILWLIAFVLVTISLPTDTVTERFNIPQGYEHAAAVPGSFAGYLQKLPLKPIGTHTKTYQGNIAQTDPYTAAVVDLSLGHEDLQQCADAVMRLRGEYLYQQKRYPEISFNFVNGFKFDYLHYAKGYRYQHNKWVLKAAESYSYATFLNYMNLVFAYASTLSLDKDLVKVKSADELQAGDVFIKGGSPGHCFIVMSVATNRQHQKVFILAQSFMPAQDIQVLKYDSPWFSLDKPANIPYGDLINTRYLKRFSN
jgi:hypothetical protein